MMIQTVYQSLRRGFAWFSRFADALIMRIVVCAALALVSGEITGCGTMAPLLEPEIGDLQLTIDILRMENRDAQRALAELRAELDSRNRVLAEAQIGRAQYEGRVREAERRLAETRRIVELQREELIFARTERERISRNRSRLQNQLSQLQKKISNSRVSSDHEAGNGLIPAGALHQEAERGMQVLSIHPARSVQPQMKKIQNARAEVMVEGIVDAGIDEEEGRNLKAGNIIVKPGDTLWSLASRFGIKVDRLRSFNNLPNDQIEIGQILRVP